MELFKSSKATQSTQGNQKYMPGACLEVPLQRRSSWLNCSYVCLQPESNPEDPCSVETPYMHGVMWPSPEQVGDERDIVPPWEVNFTRTTMLAFVGSDRGIGAPGHQEVGREIILRTLHDEASRMSRNPSVNVPSPETLFTAQADHNVDPIGDRNITAQFFIDAWELYASADFCWCPHGDTPTRRAVYDAIMFGCLPVVDKWGAEYYSRLFNGVLWRDFNVGDVFIVMPEGTESDGQLILRKLVTIPATEIELRRRSLKQIATSLQWGEHTPGGRDAFLLALTAISSG